MTIRGPVEGRLREILVERAARRSSPSASARPEPRTLDTDAMDLGLRGRRALVTAGSRGIGRAIAAELVAEGASVCISSRSPSAAASELGVPSVAFDSDDVDAVPAFVEEVSAVLGGPLDVVVVNTGGPPAGADPLGFPRSEWEDAYRSLVLTPMALVSEVDARDAVARLRPDRERVEHERPRAVGRR